MEHLDTVLTWIFHFLDEVTGMIIEWFWAIFGIFLAILALPLVFFMRWVHRRIYGN